MKKSDTDSHRRSDIVARCLCRLGYTARLAPCHIVAGSLYQALRIGAQIPTAALMALVYLYRYLISPYMPKACRFHPTCSEYALLSLKHFGFFIGSWHALKRIMSCHPFSSKDVYDPIIINNKSRQ